ncbi:hypothetical protein NDU88_004995 [Pleurodeles waltl]|uniref:Uncharacterized protein n=1 Tax=Pleurodeles waltl TaxID=8319 RepID=A0AAV7WX04_PLEWA|nr:hypothetical protein NDU88_004995 [Pleurodeles waltl]
MAATQPKKNSSVKDMLTRPAEGKVEEDASITGKHRGEEMEEDNEAPVTRAFLEGLFTSLRDDLQVVKRDLSQDPKVRVRDSPEITGAICGREEYTTALYADELVVALADPLKAVPPFLRAVEAFGTV